MRTLITLMATRYYLCASTSGEPKERQPPPKLRSRGQASFDISGRRTRKMYLGNTVGDDAHIYDKCMSSGYAFLGWGDQVGFTGCKDWQAIHQRFVEAGYKLAPNTTASRRKLFLLKVKPSWQKISGSKRLPMTAQASATRFKPASIKLSERSWAAD